MNRAARRRSAAKERQADKTRWRAGMEAFHRDTRTGGFGAFEATIVRPRTAEWLRHEPAIAKWAAALLANRDRPPLCLSCEFEFSPTSMPEAFAVLTPLHQKPAVMLVTGVCESCSGRSDDELLDVVFAGMKRMGIAKERMAVGNA